jgi:hypothetical protein
MLEFVLIIALLIVVGVLCWAFLLHSDPDHELEILEEAKWLYSEAAAKQDTGVTWDECDERIHAHWIAIAEKNFLAKAMILAATVR